VAKFQNRILAQILIISTLFYFILLGQEEKYLINENKILPVLIHGNYGSGKIFLVIQGKPKHLSNLTCPDPRQPSIFRRYICSKKTTKVGFRSPLFYDFMANFLNFK